MFCPHFVCSRGKKGHFSRRQERKGRTRNQEPINQDDALLFCLPYQNFEQIICIAQCITSLYVSAQSKVQGTVVTQSVEGFIRKALKDPGNLRVMTAHIFPFHGFNCSEGDPLMSVGIQT